MKPSYANHAFEDGIFYPVAADYHVKIVPHEAARQSHDRGAGPAPTQVDEGFGLERIEHTWLLKWSTLCREPCARRAV